MEGLLVSEVMFENLCGNSASNQKLLMKLPDKNNFEISTLENNSRTMGNE